MNNKISTKYLAITLITLVVSIFQTTKCLITETEKKHLTEYEHTFYNSYSPFQFSILEKQFEILNNAKTSNRFKELLKSLKEINTELLKINTFKVHFLPFKATGDELYIKLNKIEGAQPPLPADEWQEIGRIARELKEIRSKQIKQQ